MRIYSVLITDHATYCLDEILDYFIHQLSAYDIGKKIFNKLTESIHSLSILPRRFPMVDEVFAQPHSVHRMVVEPYIIYYLIDEENCNVHIISIVSEKKNQKEEIDTIQYSLESLFGKDFFIHEPTTEYNV